MLLLDAYFVRTPSLWALLYSKCLCMGETDMASLKNVFKDTLMQVYIDKYRHRPLQ